MSTGENRQHLDQAVREVRDRIDQMRDRSGSPGEQNTKAVLIEPIIEALGWDLRDWEQVMREYRGKPRDNPVDYALLLRRSPLLFIEAKDLGSDLTDRRWLSQIMGYATVVGVEWCLLTDGDQYRIYNSHAPVDVEDKLFRAVSISDEAQHQLALDTLLLLSKEKLAAEDLKDLWEAYFVDCQVQRALEDLFLGDNSSVVRLIKRAVPDLKPAQIRHSLNRADIRVDFPTTSEKPPRPSEPEINESAEKTLTIAGEVHELRYAKEILVHTADWLAQEGRLNGEDCPISVTRTTSRGADRCLVHTEPHHLDGTPFRSPEKLSNGLFVETHASRSTLEDYSRRLLEGAGIDPEVLEVRWPG